MQHHAAGDRQQHGARAFCGGHPQIPSQHDGNRPGAVQPLQHTRRARQQQEQVGVNSAFLGSLDAGGRGCIGKKMASARAYMRGLAQQGIAAALQQAAALSAENLPAQPPRVRATRCGSGAGPKSPVPAPPWPARLQRPAARAALTCAPAQGYKPAAWRHAAAYWSAFATRRDTYSAPKLRDCLDADVGFIAPPLHAAPGLCAARLPHPLARVAVPYSPAAARSAAALSVLSQVNSGSSRPKWP